MTYEESYDEAISSLFQDAIVKLDKVDTQAKESKKQIIADLAKNLEGKIPIDTISIEIINQLRGQVSERFIRECLHEKYKQKVRVDNARKQKYQRRSQEEEDKVSEKLAAVTPLNQEIEEVDENKKVIILDTDGRVSLQDDEEQEKEGRQPSTTTTDYFTMTGKPFVATSYQQQQQEQEIKEQNNNNLEESSSWKELCDKNQVESSEKSSQLITTAEDDILVEEISASTHENDILPFEFSMVFRDLRNHLAPLYSKIGDGGKVWFSGKINKNTGAIVSSNLGRINQ